MRRLAILMAIGVPLLLPAAGTAGGWAALEVDSKPTSFAPGEVWHARLTVLQHGVTPTSDLRPSVRIRPASGGKRIAYPASPTRRPGIYEARVVFPRAGRWRYAIDDGFGGIHKFAPVSVGFGPPRRAAAPPPEAAEPRPQAAEPRPKAAAPQRRDERGEEDGSALWPVGAASLLLGTGIALALVRRRNRARPVSVA